MGHDEADALLGAYVLDACDPHEEEAVRAHLDDCEDCRIQVEGMYQAAGWLGLDVSEEPPHDLRSRILDAAEEIE